jgi:hypothetical protein
MRCDGVVVSQVCPASAYHNHFHSIITVFTSNNSVRTRRLFLLTPDLRTQKLDILH